MKSLDYKLYTLNYKLYKSMIKQGFIKKIGEPKKWQTKEGEDRFTYRLTLSIPFSRNDGKQGEDVIIAKHVCANPDYVKQLHELMDNHAELDLTIGFMTDTYEGKEYTNIKLFNLSQRIG